MLEVTIPVLNEETRLPEYFPKAWDFVQKSNLPISFSIADNGSTDSTWAIAEKLAAKYSNTRLVKVSRRGVGLALKESWSSSSAEFVGYMDVDLATDLSHLKEVLQILSSDQVDVLTGSRLLPGSVVLGRSLLREVTSRGFNFLLGLLLRVPFSDGMCGFKFIRRQAFLDISSSCPAMTDGWFFNTEFMVKAIWKAYRLKELPVKWKDDSESRVKVVQLSAQYFQEILRLRSEFSTFKKKGSHE